MKTFPYSSFSRGYALGYPQPRRLDSGVTPMRLGVGILRIRDELGQPIDAYDCLIEAVPAADATIFNDFYDDHRAAEFYWADPYSYLTYEAVFDPDNPPQVRPHPQAYGRWDIRFTILPTVPTVQLTGDTSQQFYGGDAMIDVVNLAAGADIADLPVFAAAQGMVITSAYLLTKGTPAGIDDSNTVVLTVKDDGGNTLLTKTYDTGTQPPTNDAEDLTSLLDSDYTTLSAGDHLTLSVTQGATANMPAFSVVFGGYYV